MDSTNVVSNSALDAFAKAPINYPSLDTAEAVAPEEVAPAKKAVRVKVQCGDDIRRFDMGPQRGLPFLLETVAGLYSLPLPDKLPNAARVAPDAVTAFALKWKDAEGDLVTLASGADVKLALAETGEAMLRLVVVKNKDVETPAEAEAETIPNPFPAWRRKLFAAAAAAGACPPAARGKGVRWGGEGSNCPGRRLARFVAHVKPADGAPVPPGHPFKKVWRVRNDSTVPWPASVQLLYVSGEAGDALGAPSAVPVPGLLAPGKEVDIKIKMVAPDAPGEYEGFWRLSDASGAKFGQRLRAAVVVAEDAKTRKELKKEAKAAKKAAKKSAAGKAGAAATEEDSSPTENDSESDFEVLHKPGEEPAEAPVWAALRALRGLGFTGKRAKAVCLASGGDLRATLATLAGDNPKKAKKAGDALKALDAKEAAAAAAPADGLAAPLLG